MAVGLVFAGVNVNAHYAYYPTLAALAGERAHDQVSAATLARLEAASTVEMPTHGIVTAIDIPGVRSGFEARPAVVYLPPAWQIQPRPALPVVLLLAGTPGTPWDWTRAGYADPERRRATIAQTPLGRLGDPQDLVGAILFLASDDSVRATGSTVTVDGGYNAM